jgi:hypothetical protein
MQISGKGVDSSSKYLRIILDTITPPDPFNEMLDNHMIHERKKSKPRKEIRSRYALHFFTESLWNRRNKRLSKVSSDPVRSTIKGLESYGWPTSGRLIHYE